MMNLKRNTDSKIANSEQELPDVTPTDKAGSNHRRYANRRNVPGADAATVWPSAAVVLLATRPDRTASSRCDRRRAVLACVAPGHLAARGRALGRCAFR